MTDETPDAPTPSGGQGAEDERTLSRSDLAMIRRAMKAEWKIPPQIMDALPSHVAKIFQNETSARAKLAAAKVLVSMAAENRSTAHMAVHATQGQTPLVNVVNVVNNPQRADNGTGKIDIDELAGIMDELQNLRIGLRQGEPEPILPAQAVSETEGVPDAGEDGSIS